MHTKNPGVDKFRQRFEAFLEEKLFQLLKLRWFISIKSPTYNDKRYKIVDSLIYDDIAVTPATFGKRQSAWPTIWDSLSAN